MNPKLRPVLQVTLPVLIVGLGALAQKRLASLWEAPAASPPTVMRPRVSTVVAQPSALQLVVKAQGVVRPRTQTTLVSEVEGRVIEVAPAFREGGFFRQGQLLLRLDDTDLRSAREEANSRVATAELLLTQEQADAEISLRDWKSLHGDTPAPPLVARTPQLNRARAERMAALAALSRAERDLERTRIIAPYPGRVQERFVEFGTFVTRGREIAKIYSVDFAEVRLPIPDSDLAALDIPLAQTRAVSTDGAESSHWPRVRLEADFGGATHTWDGRIVRTGGVIDPMSRMLVLVAEVEDPYGLLRPSERAPLVSGLFVDAHIMGRSLESAFSLPPEALRPGNRVFLLDREDRLEIRAVQIARSEHDRVIVHSGLRAGDRVIDSPLETPIQGMQLREAQPTPDRTAATLGSLAQEDSKR